MLSQEQFLLVQLITKIGTTAAISLLDGIKNAKTIEDAIAALQATQKITAADFKREEQT